MKPEDMDKTQLMRPVDGQSQGAARDRKFDTQPLPAIHDEETGGIQPAFPKQMAGESDNFRGVRELPPENIPPKREKPASKGFFTAGKKKGLLLTACFAVALLGGFMLAGYSQDHSEAKQNQQQMERQQMQAKEKKLADQEADLKARRQELERQKQELQARIWAYNRLIGLQGLIVAHRHGCRNRYEAAEYLDVTEELLEEAVNYYRGKYGIMYQVDNFVIYFEPCFGVFESISPA